MSHQDELRDVRERCEAFHEESARLRAQLAQLTQERDDARAVRDEEIVATQHTYRAGYEHGKSEATEQLAQQAQQIATLVEKLKTTIEWCEASGRDAHVDLKHLRELLAALQTDPRHP